MLVHEAKAVACEWVRANARTEPRFWGAFFHGSTTWLPDDAMLPTTSDVDVVIVLAAPRVPPKLGKLRYRDVLLDVSYLARAELQAPERVLGLSHLAGSFRRPSIIADPSGQLTALQTAVTADYAKRRWVYQRCEHVQDKIFNNLRSFDAAAPLHDQVVPWLFATGLTTHVLLVAGLQNPTVRRRYGAAREVLAAYGREAFYETLLELLGAARMRREQVEQHLAALTAAFDAAKGVIRTPFFFASDLSDLARPIAIEGSRELIARGDHREAVFWMVAT